MTQPYLSPFFVNTLPLKLEKMVRESVVIAEKRIVKLLNISRFINIIIANQKSNTIPEMGISGETLSDDLIIIYLDKRSNKITQANLISMIAHEINHAQRWFLLPKFDNTLAGSLILEGLACAFEQQINPHQPSFFIQTISSRSSRNSEKIKAVFNKELFIDNFSWQKKRKVYFVSGNEKLKLPRWAGYQLGLYLVQNKINSSGKKASELISLPVNDFFNYIK